MILLIGLVYKVHLSEKQLSVFPTHSVVIFCFLLQREVAKVLCISRDIWVYGLIWNVCMLLLG